MTYTATYSPEDNKIRLSASSRLSAEEYARVKAAGFKWAPKQEVFIAPMWTPEREDLALEFAGEIEDEDSTLMDRAEQRAERFEDYSDKRAADAESARRHVASIADGIPLGQPILVGHHSEKHARRDAEKIENGMRRAVKMWETSKYWTDRAAAAVRHAKYKELPSVRARRIKGLESDARKQERYIDSAVTSLNAWEAVAALPEAEHAAVTLAGRSSCGNLMLPRKEGDREDWTQRCDAYAGLTNHYPSLYAQRTVAEVVAAARGAYPRSIAHHTRWLNHFQNRLAYERAMLQESGGTAADKNTPLKGGGCRCWATPRGGWSFIQKVNRVSVTVLDNWGNAGDRDGTRNFTRNIPFDKLAGFMSPSEIEALRADGRIVNTQDGTGYIVAPLQAPKPESLPEQAPMATDSEFEAMQASLKAGIKTVSAPQLFPTPSELAQKMAYRADLHKYPALRILEPSAGTGNILEALKPWADSADIQAVEINHSLADGLSQRFNRPQDAAAGICKNVLQADFLECDLGTLGTYDRILMNPPFIDGQDVEHVQHAYRFLNPGGILVSVMCSGPFFRSDRKSIAFRAWVDEVGAEVEDLPADTFKSSGTGVSTKLVVIRRPDNTPDAPPIAGVADTEWETRLQAERLVLLGGPAQGGLS